MNNAVNNENQQDAISRRRVWGWALLGSFLTWLAFPPVGWWMLAWFAPSGWLVLVAVPRLPAGRRTWLALWCASWAFWLAYLQGIRLAHPALYLGWCVLAAYLAIYMPVFVALARLAVHRYRWPLTIAAPVTWVALELVRGAFVTGFSGGLTGHALTRWTLAIQVADLGGAYAVSFVVVMTSACLVEAALWWRSRGANDGEPRSRRAIVLPVALAVSVLVGDLAYGWWRLHDATNGGRVLLVAPLAESSSRATAGTAARDPADVPSDLPTDASIDDPARSPSAPGSLRVAVIQESIDAIFEFNEARNRETFERYRRNTLDVLNRYGPVDLIVWPESSYTENSPEILVRDGFPNGELARRIRAFEDKTNRLMTDIRAAGANSDRPAWLVAGTVTVEVSPQGVAEYNSALLIDPAGRVSDRYYKQHLVMFGEYIPLGNWIPGLYRLAGMPGGLAEGPRPGLFDVKGARLSPSICFESLVPHLIRRQVAFGRQAGHPPAMLVNVTNDGWFWGSSILDTHLQSGVFRAIEHRRPIVIAANTGLSAVIDPQGRARTLPRRESGALVADVFASGLDDAGKGGEPTVYERVGDWPWLGCVLAVLGVAASALAGRVASRGDVRTVTSGRDRRD